VGAGERIILLLLLLLFLLYCYNSRMYYALLFNCRCRRRRGDEKIRVEGYPVEAHEKGKKPTLMTTVIAVLYFTINLYMCMSVCAYTIVTR